MASSWFNISVTFLIFISYLLGLYSAYHAIMHSRTSQGSTAWAVSLLTIPYLTLPFYWTFGRVKYYDYGEYLQDFERELMALVPKAIYEKLIMPMERFSNENGTYTNKGEIAVLEKLAKNSFSSGNHIKLLIDGKKTYDSIITAIHNANEYILAQYYEINDDVIGNRFKNALLDAVNRGVNVYLQYDELGSYDLPDEYLEELNNAGINVSRFSGSGKGWIRRLRLNFRNHRKIVVIDGKTSFMGGLNIGDEYLGWDNDFGPWRDTHLEIKGPATYSLQVSFLRDWYFGTEELPSTKWKMHTHNADQSALILTTGPVEELENCGLMFTHCISSAKDKVWVATPYFVPDERVLSALQLAALKGLDVRIMMPCKTDNILFKFAPYAYLKDLLDAGAKVYLYEKGFMHQKVLLIDNKYSIIGTANMDNRSFYLNFETVAVVNDQNFCSQTEEMIVEDFKNASILTEEDIYSHPWWFIFLTRLTRLLSPIL